MGGDEEPVKRSRITSFCLVCCGSLRKGFLVCIVCNDGVHRKCRYDTALKAGVNVCQRCKAEFKERREEIIAMAAEARPELGDDATAVTPTVPPAQGHDEQLEQNIATVVPPVTPQATIPRPRRLIQVEEAESSDDSANSEPLESSEDSANSEPVERLVSPGPGGLSDGEGISDSGEEIHSWRDANWRDSDWEAGEVFSADDWRDEHWRDYLDEDVDMGDIVLSWEEDVDRELNERGVELPGTEPTSIHFEDAKISHQDLPPASNVGKEQVCMPACIIDYNKFMGGVDLSGRTYGLFCLFYLCVFVMV